MKQQGIHTRRQSAGYNLTKPRKCEAYRELESMCFFTGEDCGYLDKWKCEHFRAYIAPRVRRLIEDMGSGKCLNI